MAIVSNLAFMDAIRETALLSPSQMDVVQDRVSNRLVDARTIGRIMLQEGWLSVYQINQLLAGHGRQLVIGPYQVLDRLGQGGQSTVYKARRNGSDNIVALKVIREDFLGDPEASAQFMQEMEAMATLDHPNVVQFCDADKEGDLVYCAMEYVEGTDLGKYVRLAGPLPSVEACDYIRQAALGLQHAHERNLIHRDIKPVNLCLTGTPSSTLQGKVEGVGSLVKILDWGLADLSPPNNGMQAESPSGAKLLIGTADYLSPEQALDPDGVDIRGDIYSLGCTFYYLLAAHPPFPDGKVMQKILAHQKETPMLINHIRADLPLGVAMVIKRMLAKKPEDRYQTPAAVAMALKPYCRADRYTEPRLTREARQRRDAGYSSSPSTFSPKGRTGTDDCSHSTFGPREKGDTLDERAVR